MQLQQQRLDGRSCHGRALLLAVFVLASGLFSSCKVLFWQDSRSWGGGRWQGEQTFYEMQYDFETKAHWYALNQNALVRNYQTTVLEHKISGQQVTTRELATFPGWTLEHSLYVLGEALVLVRGSSDSLGEGPRQVLLLAPKSDTKTWQVRTLHESKRQLLTAMPSPDRARLAVLSTSATMEQRTGELFVDIFPLASADASLGTPVTARIEYPGAPGMPNIAWAPNSELFFVQRTADVQEIAAASGTVRPSKRFPQCWLWTTSNVSDSGRALFRSNPDGTVEFRRVESWIPHARIPMTSDFSRIGAGCP